jgi:hypothetical protein
MGAMRYIVMPALVAGIHVLGQIPRSKAWMAPELGCCRVRAEQKACEPGPTGSLTSPAMT